MSRVLAPSVLEALRDPERTAAVRAYLPVAGQAGLDDLAALAAAVTGCPIGAVTLIDETDQHHVGRFGTDLTSLPLAMGTCAHTAASGTALQVCDATSDPRFADHPFVLAEGGLRAYLGVPIVTDGGQVLGTVCALDVRTRESDAAAVEHLRTLARQAARSLHLGLVQLQDEQHRHEVRRLARQLAERQDFLDALIDTMDVGVFAVDADGALTLANRMARDWHGDPDPDATADEAAAVFGLFRSDGHTPLPYEELPMLRAMRDGAVHDSRIVIAPPGRPRRHLRIHGRAVHDRDGQLLGAVTAAHDITDLTQREAELARSLRDAELLATATGAILLGDQARAALAEAARSLADASYVALMEPDGLGNLVRVGEAGGLLPPIVLSLDQPSLTAAAFRSGRAKVVADVHAEQGRDRAALAQIELATGRPVRASIHLPVTVAGSTRAVLAIALPEAIGVDLAHVVGLLQVLVTQAGVALERETLLRQLAEQALVDSLTGAANRRAWRQAGSREVTRAHRTGSPLCLAIFDLDHFKAVNDRLGHAAGDDLLREGTHAWQRGLREQDVLARLGGEEFAVLLPETDLPEAVRQAELLRRRTPEGATISVGVAQLRTGESVGELEARADRAMYEAKHTGRNRTCADPAGTEAGSVATRAPDQRTAT